MFSVITFEPINIVEGIYVAVVLKWPFIIRKFWETPSTSYYKSDSQNYFQFDIP